MFLLDITAVDLDPENKRVILLQCTFPFSVKILNQRSKILFFSHKLCVKDFNLCSSGFYIFLFKFTLHYSLHVAAALLYVSFQDADFFCRDVVQHDLLVAVFLSRSLAQLQLKMTSVFLI